MPTAPSFTLRIVALATTVLVLAAVAGLAVVAHQRRTSHREAVAADPALAYRSATKGEVIELGVYEQDGDAADGAEPIQWFVLDRLDNRLLLLSVDCLASRPYNAESFAAVTWEHSDLRRWLNDAFLDTAFTAAEQQLISPAQLRNDDQSIVGISGGQDTTDRVFVLSQTEALIYLHDDADRDYFGRAAVSTYAATGTLHVDEEGLADWWLRSPGGYEYTAQYVRTNGETAVSGAYVDAEYGVRPALWLDVSEAGDGAP
ncbi:DUF6273 domain-containing protein [Actinomyces sp.]|uniref:DUF6273 domain-containing protein n=1 Tax=Actinomyces sp. TaxID=29317 RepID=UPI0026DCCF58|nr:DUF6273 domain-containing protein [Actinomyces sp.]MDO4901623.1 DUF6273 domain-containing protein [Actinomyces sp.]